MPDFGPGVTYVPAPATIPNSSGQGLWDKQKPAVWLGSLAVIALVLTLMQDSGAPELAAGLTILIVGGATIMLLPGAISELGIAQSLSDFGTNNSGLDNTNPNSRT